MVNIRLLLVDDHGTVRESLRFVFGAAGMRQLEEAATCRNAIRAVRKGLIDVVLLDLTMRDGEGLETLRKIREINAELPVLIHSYHDSAGMLSRSFHLGACGYVVKGEDKNVLIDSVRRAARGCNVWTLEQIERINELDSHFGIVNSASNL